MRANDYLVSEKITEIFAASDSTGQQKCLVFMDPQAINTLGKIVKVSSIGDFKKYCYKGSPDSTGTPRISSQSAGALKEIEAWFAQDGAVSVSVAAPYTLPLTDSTQYKANASIDPSDYPKNIQFPANLTIYLHAEKLFSLPNGSPALPGSLYFDFLSIKFFQSATLAKALGLTLPPDAPPFYQVAFRNGSNEKTIDGYAQLVIENVQTAEQWPIPAADVNCMNAPTFDPDAMASIIANNDYYSYVLPDILTDGDDGKGTLEGIISATEKPGGRTYFFLNSLANFNYDASKDPYFSIRKYMLNPHRNVCYVQSADTGATSRSSFQSGFSRTTVMAIASQWSLTKPTAQSKLAPFSNRFLAGDLPFYQTGKDRAKLDQMDDFFVNYACDTPSNSPYKAMFNRGFFNSGIDMQQLYAEDWMNITAEQQLTAAIVSGSQPGRNPLFYDQDGIDRLVQVLESVITLGLGNGCVLEGTASAVPFAKYVAENPTDYQNGIYNGLYLSYVLRIGLKRVQLNVTADFSAQTAITSGGGA